MAPFAWVLIGLTILGFGMWGFIGKIGSESVGRYPYVVISYLTVTVIAWIFMIFSSGPSFSFSLKLFYPVIGGLFTALAILSYFKAIETVPVSLVTPLISLYPALTVVLSLLFLGESLSTTKILGVVLALIAGVLLGL
ncbi:MAG: EamA family transporter [Candidatus Tectomicrobia bacterium]|nr:EamA family transporter [Candidatus Tectomicrobia bacterium]